MAVSWYARRLGRMTPREVLQRVADEYRKARWRARWAGANGNDAGTLPRMSARPYRPLLDPSVRLAVPAIGVERLRSAADRIAGGRHEVFGRPVSLDPVPDWFLDPKTGRRAPADAFALHIGHNRLGDRCDVKHVWELSRHQHLTLLAAACFLEGTTGHARIVERHLRSWWAANPFLSGIHWTSGIEIGLRLISWTWIRRLLDGWDGAPQLFEENPAFVRQLHHHQEYLHAFSSHGSSANNHVLAEAAGQFIAACAFPLFPETGAWRARAATTLRHEVPLQTFASGFNKEQATDYHGFVLELALAALVEGEAAGSPLGESVWDGARRMTDALAATVDVRGRPPRQGDSDAAFALLVDAPDFDRWDSLLATGARLFGAAPWWPPVRGEDVRTALLTSLVGTPPPSGERPASRPSLWADAGMAILRDTTRRPDEIWCRCDHGPHGYLATAAHAHADALSIEVRAGGVDILADPGTYCYHDEPASRAYFQSTAGHNTLELGGLDQSVRGGPFLWTRHARSWLIDDAGLTGGRFATWSAAHDGYRRLVPPAVHRRSVRLDRVERSLEIEDAIETTGAHDCRLRFHLGPDVRCTLSAGEARLHWSADGREHRASLELPAALDWSMHAAEEGSTLGWYSPAFGQKLPSTTLSGAGVANGNTVYRTVLRFADGGAKPSTSDGAREGCA